MQAMGVPNSMSVLLASAARAFARHCRIALLSDTRRLLRSAAWHCLCMQSHSFRHRYYYSSTTPLHTPPADTTSLVGHPPVALDRRGQRLGQDLCRTVQDSTGQRVCVCAGQGHMVGGAQRALQTPSPRSRSHPQTYSPPPTAPTAPTTNRPWCLRTRSRPCAGSAPPQSGDPRSPLI